MDELRANIRVSSLPAWADCGGRANHELQRSGPLPGRPHVGAVVGTLVHQRLLEGPNAQWKLPDYIEWDQHTRNTRELFLQVDLLSDRALRHFGDRGWKMVSSEIEMQAEFVDYPGIRLNVTGHMDALIETVANQSIISRASFELKTGINPPRGAWLQTGGYAWLWQDPEALVIRQPLNLCVVLWIDRRDGTVQWEERAPGPLVEMAEAQLNSIAWQMRWGAMFNPSSLSCTSCLNAECALRFGGPNVHLPDPPNAW